MLLIARHKLIVDAAPSDEDKSFLQEVSKTDPFHDKKRILAFKGPLLPGSFDWILDHAEFKRWRDTQDSGVFWIKGDPGKGKTMLLCGIIEDFETTSQNANLAYFFCQATDSRINTAAAIVGGLVFSLLKKYPALLSRTREKYENGPKDQLDGVNSLVVLCDIFETITQDPSLADTVCVVDALDECIKDCSHLLNLIIKTSGHVKWLLSSRNEKDIERKLDSIPQRLVLELKQNAEHISTSIDTYISHHIHKIPALRGDTNLQARTLSVLKSKAQGTFLWVALVVEQLHDTDHWKVEDVLEEMPKDLESLYRLILSRTQKLGRKGQEVCQVLLSIVTTAKRPLRVRELLVFINSHWKNDDRTRGTFELRDVRDMTKDCGSILSIRDDTIYFVHQSAKDYIMENAAQHIFPIQHQHYRMFEASLDAMSSVLQYDIYNLKKPGIHIDEIPVQSPDDALASVRYCCVFWIDHLIAGCQFEGFEHQKYLEDDGELHSFLNAKFLCWIESMALMRSIKPQAVAALGKLKQLLNAGYHGGERNNRSQTSQDIGLQREGKAKHLVQFVNDANRFVIRSIRTATSWPLQLYFSAIQFEQNDSTIRRRFEQTVRERFGPSPIVIDTIKNQLPLLMETLPSAHTSPLCHYKCLIFSHDAAFIGGLDVNRGFTIWRTDTGTLEHNFLFDLISIIAFLPDSNDFISVSRKGIIRRWSINTKSCIEEYSLNLIQDGYLGICDQRLPTNLTEQVIGLSPNGDLAASLLFTLPGERNMVKVWETSMAICKCTIACDEFTAAAFSPNSELLALANNDVRIYRVKTGQIIQHPEICLSVYRSMLDMRSFLDKHLVFSPDSQILAIAQSSKHLSLWNTSTGGRLHQIVEHKLMISELNCIAISPDSAILATRTFDGFSLWSIDTGKCISRVTGGARLIAFSPDWTEDLLVATLTEDNAIEMWSVEINQSVNEVEYIDYTFTDVLISPDSRFVASKRKNHAEIHIWGGDNGQLLRVLRRDLDLYNEYTTCYKQVFSPNSELLASYPANAYNTTIHVWRITTGEIVRLIRAAGWTIKLAFSADSCYLAQGDRRGQVWIWRIASGQCVYKYVSDDITRMIHYMEFSPDLAYVAAEFYVFGTLQILNCYTGQWVTLGSETGLIEKLAFSSDSAILVAIEFNDVQIWDAVTGVLLQHLTFDHQFSPASFDPLSCQIRTGTFVFDRVSREHWLASPRLGYTLDNPIDDYDGSKGNLWILLGNEQNFLIPKEFRVGVGYQLKFAISDCLCAFVNGLGGVSIIKLPTIHEPQEKQSAGMLDSDRPCNKRTLSSGSSSLDLGVEAASGSGS